jgi:pentatricopeptide repeat protein
LFEEMISEGLIGSTESYNSCIWAAEQGGRHDISLRMLSDMEKNEVPRSQSTYAACAYSCEKAGEGEIALHVMDLMRNDGYDMDTPVYKAVIWACVKAGMWEKSLELFEEMEVEGKLRDEDCYSGAIWACFSGSQWEKAVGFMKLMKFEGLERKTIAYDGAFSALQAGGQWEACLDMMTWMDRENPVTLKSKVTYEVILQALDDASKEEEMIEIYLRALRDNYFIPWVKGSRLADLRGYTLPVAKIAIKNILLSMKEGKLAPFNLHVAVCDASQPEEWSSQVTYYDVFYF